MDQLAWEALVEREKSRHHCQCIQNAHPVALEEEESRQLQVQALHTRQAGQEPVLGQLAEHSGSYSL